ncbi:hypothetical protein D018_2744B, partial [Vibrio parahaemolyticus VP2007-007]
SLIDSCGRESAFWLSTRPKIDCTA